MSNQLMIYSLLNGNKPTMSDISQFCTYLDMRWYSQSTITRHKSYLIYYVLFLLENWLEHNYNAIQMRKNDLKFYVSNNTINKYISTISVYSHYRNIICEDYKIRPERIENVKYIRENSYQFQWDNWYKI